MPTYRQAVPGLARHPAPANGTRPSCPPSRQLPQRLCARSKRSGRANKAIKAEKTEKTDERRSRPKKNAPGPDGRGHSSYLLLQQALEPTPATAPPTHHSSQGRQNPLNSWKSCSIRKGSKPQASLPRPPKGSGAGCPQAGAGSRRLPGASHPNTSPSPAEDYTSNTPENYAFAPTGSGERPTLPARFRRPYATGTTSTYTVTAAFVLFAAVMRSVPPAAISW